MDNFKFQRMERSDIYTINVNWNELAYTSLIKYINFNCLWRTEKANRVSQHDLRNWSYWKSPWTRFPGSWRREKSFGITQPVIETEDIAFSSLLDMFSRKNYSDIERQKNCFRKAQKIANPSNTIGAKFPCFSTIIKLGLEEKLMAKKTRLPKLPRIR